jgi:selenocysteine lyase/cysteine desulfurase
MKGLVATRDAFGMTFACPPGYLDTPSVGIPPLPAVDALLAAIRDWQVGATVPARFDDSVDAARRAFAVLCGVPAPTVAIGGSVSELVGLTASAAPDGARVLTAAGDFASVIFPFAAHARRGVTIDEVPVAEIPARAAGYDYVAASAVQSRDGTVLDLEALRDAVAGRGTRVILDVTHACGWLPLRLDWADAVVGCGYKWLLSPRGVAWMAIREDYAAGLTATSAGWYGGETPWDSLYGLPLRQAAGSRRFDTSPAWFCHLGAASVLPALAATDPGERYAHCTGLANALRAELGLPPSGSAIVSVAAPGVAEHLAGAGVRASIRDGRARLGFFLYNNADDLDRAVSALAGKISGKAAQ